MFKSSVPARAWKFCILLGLLLLPFPTSAQIDNCCFVDRQCATDEEWNAGYYAFQSGQCVAPSQPAFRRSTPAQIDNCCFGGWQCGADEDWISGYFAFQHDHCAIQRHWEAQWQKRKSVAAAAPDNDQHQQVSQGSDARQAGRAIRTRWQLPPPPNVQYETRPWYACGVPCPPPNPGPPRTITIEIDLTNPDKRREEADDGTPVVVHPELPD